MYKIKLGNKKNVETQNFVSLTCLFIACVFVGTASSLRAQVPNKGGVVFVKEKPSGNASGDSWTNGCSLSNALRSAKSNNKIEQIWVAAGTYKPKHLADGSSTDPRDQSFVLVDGVEIYGGFAGTETDITQRPPMSTGQTSSILSGDLDDDNKLSDKDAYHVLVAASLNDALLDGFTITGGNANGTGSIRVGVSPTDTLTVYRYNGGGIYLTESSLTLKNLIIDGNTAKNGGAIYSFYSDPKLINCFITNNTATEKGSALYNAVYPDVPTAAIMNDGSTGGGFTNYRLALSWGPPKISVRNSVPIEQQLLDLLNQAKEKHQEYQRLIEPEPFYDADGDGLRPAGSDDGTSLGGDPYLVFIPSNNRLDNRNPSLRPAGDGPIVINRYWPKIFDASGNAILPDVATWYAQIETRKKAFKQAATEIEAMMAAIKASPLYAMTFRVTDVAGVPLEVNPIKTLYDNMGQNISHNPPLEQCQQLMQFDVSGSRVTLTSGVSGFLYEYYLGYVPWLGDYEDQAAGASFAFPGTKTKPQP
ncbi:hypothetical protein FACS1894121_0210 [Bacteroidia bacterium]|nr:hypothetical protein FACS1894121_0210 [Bacteroidia bacterium]